MSKLNLRQKMKIIRKFNLLQMSDDILGVLDEHLTKLEESLTKFGDEWSKNLAKLSDGIQHLEKELILDSDNGELSIMAQVIRKQKIQRAYRTSLYLCHFCRSFWSKPRIRPRTYLRHAFIITKVRSNYIRGCYLC